MNHPQPEDNLRELERLAKLRREVAACLLEVSAAAERDAEALLSAGTGMPGSAASAREVVQPTGDVGTTGQAHPAWSRRFLYGSFVLGLAGGFVLALLTRPFGSEPPPRETGEARQQIPEVAAVPSAPDLIEATPAPPATVATQVAEEELREETGETPIPPAVTPPVVVLTLTARRPCWISAVVDGGEPVECLMPRAETIVLQVEEEVSLRVGDAAALSILVNDQPMKPLGADGQVVNLRITPANFHTFLLDEPT